MTPSELNVLKSLVAVAWADGQMADEEAGVIDGLLSVFDATPEQEAEVVEFAQSPRTLADIPVAALGDEDRELLLSNAALLTLADGDQSASERALLGELTRLLGFSEADAEPIIASAREGALHVGTKLLDD